MKRGLFHHLETRQWLNLATAGVALLWAMDIAWTISSRGLFEYIGIDFRTLRTAALVARTEGYASVYDLGKLEPGQRLLYNQYSHGLPRMPFETVPMPYLPAFVVLFQPLLLVPPLEGFVALGVLNIAGCYFYFRRLRSGHPTTAPWPKPVHLLVALPVVLTAMVGQVNLLLLIAFGEAVLAAMAGHRLRAGLWLGGLMIKPQTLILLGPVLALTGQWTMLAGLGMASLGIVAASLFLAGPSGLVDLANLVLLYPRGLPTTFPESMMNWRSLGILLESSMGGSFPEVATVAGTIATVMAVLYLALTRNRQSPDQVPLVATATFAGTLVLAWHSHVHMALPILPWLAYLSARGLLSFRLVAAYVLLPATALAGGSLLVGAGQAHILAGLAMLTLNLLVVFGLVKHRHATTENRLGTQSDSAAGPP